MKAKTFVLVSILAIIVIAVVVQLTSVKVTVVDEFETTDYKIIAQHLSSIEPNVLVYEILDKEQDQWYEVLLWSKGITLYTATEDTFFEVYNNSEHPVVYASERSPLAIFDFNTEANEKEGKEWFAKSEKIKGIIALTVNKSSLLKKARRFGIKNLYL
ncbi:hypothetical protein A2755_03265 [Candidatus Wolfebacteria bacterium RIFCSPHIGHO2_01_FULL_48_22]|uniref:Uncharacterized protein n=2 Tax=Candidatus Wolfeibacteriota TaxID=1752735 RepID=A0A1F8DRG0_9BACT|nr:MAG: hypothetical protein A2755_03265 [Candidatus Wolfebacteria bacterium RIFCSPHIGHO2_01_FULL_48_22]OGM92049.1 MAG: hypothetical protein A2935_01755 [Candidatus Wolfebacteria bacterium RIFCSPLOWO2_01_FULL_47_17b]